jgi:hypothetical protein
MLELVLGRIATGLLTGCLLLAGPLAGALAGAVLVPIAGLEGGKVTIAGSLRTSDGGAIVVARVGRSAAARKGSIVVARLESDGALDLAYGTEGLTTLQADPRLEPTALAIDPATGAAWIGASDGARGRGEVIALNGAGAAARAFGRRGVLKLPARDDGGPVALAWRAGALLLAAGSAPCGGCQLALRQPGSGRVLASATLPALDVAPVRCRGAGITGAVFALEGPSLSTSGGRGRRCTATILRLGRTLRVLAPPAWVGTLPAGHATELAGTGSSTCAASSGSAATAIRPVSAGATVRATLAPAGRLLALVSLGQGACAALVAGRGGADVEQMQAGARRAVSDRVARDVAAQSMFRCNQHLLVLGTVAGGGRRTAVILPVPVRRGPFARASAAALAAPPSTGCGGG